MFGAVVIDEVRLNDAGRMLVEAWESLPRDCPGTALDTFVVMPNHLHGIVVIERSGSAVRLPDMLRRFKSRTAVRYGRGVRTYGWPAFDRHLWQRSYHDHVVRDDEDLARIRRYIEENPLKWALDEENPALGTTGSL